MVRYRSYTYVLADWVSKLPVLLNVKVVPRLCVTFSLRMAGWQQLWKQIYTTVCKIWLQWLLEVDWSSELPTNFSPLAPGSSSATIWVPQQCFWGKICPRKNQPYSYIFSLKSSALHAAFLSFHLVKNNQCPSCTPRNWISLMPNRSIYKSQISTPCVIQYLLWFSLPGLGISLHRPIPKCQSTSMALEGVGFITIRPSIYG